MRRSDMPMAVATLRTKLAVKPLTSSAISAKGRWMCIVSSSPAAAGPHPRGPLPEEPPQLSREAALVGSPIGGLSGGNECTSAPAASGKAPGSTAGVAPGTPPKEFDGAAAPSAGKPSMSPLPKAMEVGGWLSAGKALLLPPPKAPKSWAESPSSPKAPGGCELLAAGGKAGGPLSPQPPPLLPKVPKSTGKPPAPAPASSTGLPPGQPLPKPPPSEVPPKLSPPQASSLSFFFFFSFRLPTSDPSEACSKACTPVNAAWDATGEEMSSPREGPEVLGTSGAGMSCPSAAASSLASRSSSSSWVLL
mmetsp:Transcript_33968/g.94030  ORF Transcript_33968/g.94030 Transcript_33968/m.94030 type:complete len:306 (+) Transcript_33968:238-1155(+)